MLVRRVGLVSGSATSLVALLNFSACGSQPAMSAAVASPALTSAPIARQDPPPTTSQAAPELRRAAQHEEAALTVAVEPPHCSPADWSARSLAPLLKPGKTPSPSQPDRSGAHEHAFDPECTDAPDGPRGRSTPVVVLDGVEIRLASATPAGSTGRRWTGNQCAFDFRLADGSGVSLRLGADDVPPFTAITALVRSGSAIWLAVAFNGYTREFPKGGNRILALDLCVGRVVWKSKDSMSNGGLLLLGDYLISPYGFTSERRYVFVLDARSGAIVQKLPVVENICPSKSWAPNWHPGDRCDAPGQAVGAATAPRAEGGTFLVDTNTGSSSFQLQ